MTAAVEIRGLSKVFNAGRPDAVPALVDIDLDRGSCTVSVKPGDDLQQPSLTHLAQREAHEVLIAAEKPIGAHGGGNLAPCLVLSGCGRPGRR